MAQRATIIQTAGAARPRAIYRSHPSYHRHPFAHQQLRTHSDSSAPSAAAAPETQRPPYSPATSATSVPTSTAYVVVFKSGSPARHVAVISAHCSRPAMPIRTHPGRKASSRSALKLGTLPCDALHSRTHACVPAT